MPIEERANAFPIYSNPSSPFLAQSAITYFLSERGEVSIEIFDLAGRRGRNIFSGEKSPGVYFCSLAREGRRIFGKVVLLR